MANRLAGETSPYLLQHKDNPVDWYPWGEEALAAARERDVPILLSIGYSACHWCHVMERESFEDADTAALHERALRLHQGRPRGAARPRRDLHGGVPGDDRPGRLAAERLPDARPGAVLRRHLLPARRATAGCRAGSRCCARCVEAWSERGDEIRATADKVAERLSGAAWVEPVRRAAGPARCSTAPSRTCAALDDPRNGGFGGGAEVPAGVGGRVPAAPRGERATVRVDQRRARAEAMAGGGIYDQLGGGFARYSVDAGWLVPHFEKMLYDNALLARAYLHGWQVTGDAAVPARLRGDARLGAARDARPRGRLLLGARRRLRGRGGPVLRLDASTQLREVLGDGDDAQAALDYFGVQPGGNFEGADDPDPRRPRSPRASTSSRRRLYDARAERVWPGLDDKRLTSWNALMIARARRRRRGARAAPTTSTPRAACADFVLTRAARRRRPPAAHLEGRRGPAERLPRGPRLPARRAARRSTRRPSSRAGSQAARALADTHRSSASATTRTAASSRPSTDHEQLVARRKDLEDHPIPSGNSAAALRRCCGWRR